MQQIHNIKRNQETGDKNLKPNNLIKEAIGLPEIINGRETFDGLVVR
jgi:hypothetical protein